ncbi:MAG TPA: opioid growth factor receptor-related protein, partial [Humisphaera sp.]
MPASPQPDLVSFHLGRSPDSEGRRIDDIRRWDFDELEFVHDYIQWLFPTRRPSAFNADAPPLDDATVGAFHADGRLRASLLESLKVMLAFYGFALR